MAAVVEADTLAYRDSHRARVVPDCDQWWRRDRTPRHRTRGRGRCHDLRGQPSRDATPSGYWSRQHYVVAPTGATQLVLTGEFRRIVGDSSTEKFALAFANQGQTAWVGNQLVTLTDSWQTVSLTVSVTAGTVYRATLICHDAFLAVLNSRCLMRNLRVYPNGASGVFASSWYRLRTVEGTRVEGQQRLPRASHTQSAGLDWRAHEGCLLGR